MKTHEAFGPICHAIMSPRQARPGRPRVGHSSPTATSHPPASLLAYFGLDNNEYHAITSDSEGTSQHAWSLSRSIREQWYGVVTEERNSFSRSREVELEALPGVSALDGSRSVDAVRGPSGREYRGETLCGLGVNDEPRQSAIHIIEWRFFDPIILLLIVANCATMAWESPLDEPGTRKAALIARLELLYDSSDCCVFLVLGKRCWERGGRQAVPGERLLLLLSC